MRISELTKTGALLKDLKVKKQIAWTDINGDECTGDVTIKVLSFGVVERMVKHAMEEGTTAAVALIVAATEFEGEQLPIEMAEALDPGFANALIEAINEVNPAKKQAAPKPS